MEQKSHGISDFEKLYSRYYPKMVRFVTAYVLTRTDAENIVQDIFLDLLEKENVGSINNLNAYLFRMAIIAQTNCTLFTNETYKKTFFRSI